MRILSAIVLIPVIVGIAACARPRSTNISGQSGAATSPEVTLSRMREYDEKLDYASYVRCMTERGKGWLIAEFATGLLWDAYAQPNDPQAGNESRKILERYHLADLKWKAENDWSDMSEDELLLKIAENLGANSPRFFRDVKGRFERTFFPGDFRLVDQEQTEKSSKLIIESDELPSPFSVRFIEQSGTWLFDGCDSD